MNNMTQDYDLKTKLKIKKFIFILIGILILLFPVTWKFYSPEKKEIIFWLGLILVWVSFIWSNERKSRRLLAKFNNQ